MTLEDAIKKYNLTKQDKDMFDNAIDYELYANTINEQGKTTFVTADNQWSVGNPNLFTLTVHTLYNRKVFDKQLRMYMPYTTEKTSRVIRTGEVENG